MHLSFNHKWKGEVPPRSKVHVQNSRDRTGIVASSYNEVCDTSPIPAGAPKQFSNSSSISSSYVHDAPRSSEGLEDKN